MFLKNITSEILIFAQKFAKSNSNITHIQNYFNWINMDFISFVDSKKPKDSKILFFKYCYSSEEFYEIQRLCNKYNLNVLEWNNNYLLVIESKNSNLNKNIIINSRK